MQSMAKRMIQNTSRKASGGGELEGSKKRTPGTSYEGETSKPQLLDMTSREGEEEFEKVYSAGDATSASVMDFDPDTLSPLFFEQQYNYGGKNLEDSVGNYPLKTDGLNCKENITF